MQNVQTATTNVDKLINYILHLTPEQVEKVIQKYSIVEETLRKLL